MNDVMRTNSRFVDRSLVGPQTINSVSPQTQVLFLWWVSFVNTTSRCETAVGALVSIMILVLDIRPKSSTRLHRYSSFVALIDLSSFIHIPTENSKKLLHKRRGIQFDYVLGWLMSHETSGLPRKYRMSESWVWRTRLTPRKCGVTKDVRHPFFAVLIKIRSFYMVIAYAQYIIHCKRPPMKRIAQD